MKTTLKYLAFIISVFFSIPAVNVSAQEGLPTNLDPLYYAEDTMPLMRFGHGWANDIAWSPDGTTLAVAL